ncbi:putative disease resistance RPP8-like protein 2 [Citrus sinensis]|uniref:Disease resistance RPP8-like protein 2 n=1 Tax=Citrus sinensis TaxID=2711 RepID=A0ACB8NZH3_CITSI|nr:putative disease resistance RPP8-like protein 2 [Citrus sinensis]
MDIQFRLFSERLRRLLSGEEVTLPDAAKQLAQNLHTEIEIVTSLLRDYECEIAGHLVNIIVEEEESNSPDLHAIMEEINSFAYESEKVVDTFIVSIAQQKSQSSSKEMCDALVEFRSKIIDIQQRLQQVQHIDTGIVEQIKFIQADTGNSSVSPMFTKRDTVGLDDRMEELLDLLIEGPPRLSLVAVLDSIGLDRTAFVAEAYNSSFAKHYFDCLVWVPQSFPYNFNHILDDLIKFVMPSSRPSEILDKNSEMKKIILREYLMNKRYFVVLADVWSIDVWDNIREILPDNQNGSRVVITVLDSEILTYFQLENGEDIRLDLVPDGRPLRAEGFIPDNNEGTAEKYLEHLINRGFVEAKKIKVGSRINTCSIPNRWWPALIQVALAGEFIYSSVIDQESDSRKMIKRLTANVNLSELDSLEDFNLYLHSLLCLSSESHHLDPLDCEKICKMFKFLRVLDLGSLVLSQLPSGIENLFFLRYLKLNIPSLKSLPSSFLSSISNLYTLDMPFSYIHHTADVFWEMNKLRHLNFGLFTLPAYPRNDCGSLENLNFISALHPRCCTPDILGRLPNLRKLRIHGDLSNNQSLLSKSLYKLSSLESLKLVNESKMPRLSKIVLDEYQFPPSLTHLSFSNTELMEDPMPTLEKLPLLQVLKLKKNSYLGRKLTCGSHGFPKLKVLHLKSMLWLEEWTMGTGAMPKLECLIIDPCAYLKRLPKQLWSVKRFKKLELWRPQPELRQKLRDFKDKEQYNIQLYPYGI